MSKLWVYGCSFSSGQGVLGPEFDRVEGAVNGHTIHYDHCYGKSCADDLDMDLELKARSGVSNFYMFKTLCENMDDISYDDIVVIMWTYPYRTFFNPDSLDGTIVHSIPTHSDDEDIHPSEKYYRELYSDDRCKTETTSAIMAANKLCEGRNIRLVNTTFWDTQATGGAWFFNREFLRKCDIRFPECMMTDNITNDVPFEGYDGYHPSLEAHKIYGLQLAQYIREKYEQD